MRVGGHRRLLHFSGGEVAAQSSESSNELFKVTD